MPAKRDTGGHILTEWPFCYVKSAIEHKRRYAHRLWLAEFAIRGRCCILWYCNQKYYFDILLMEHNL